MQTSQNYQTAIAILSTATSVEHWNELRDSIKDTLTQTELAQIDGSGLITKTLS